MAVFYMNMSVFGIQRMGGYRPSLVVTNTTMAAQVATSAEWIERKTGVLSRHRAGADEWVQHLARAPNEPGQRGRKAGAQGRPGWRR